MKKVNPVEDALEREIQDLLAPYPDPMGRTDFRKACRIGTRTSIYLLQIGLVPCENTGKQTRCYKIAKADVAAYLRRRLAEPAYYTPAQRLVQELPESQAPGLQPERCAPPHRRHPPTGTPLVREPAGPPARRAGRPPESPHHRLRLPHRQPLVHRGEVKVFSLSAQL